MFICHAWRLTVSLQGTMNEPHSRLLVAGLYTVPKRKYRPDLQRIRRIFLGKTNIIPARALVIVRLPRLPSYQLQSCEHLPSCQLHVHLLYLRKDKICVKAKDDFQIYISNSQYRYFLTLLQTCILTDCEHKSAGDGRRCNFFRYVISSNTIT